MIARLRRGDVLLTVGILGRDGAGYGRPNSGAEIYQLSLCRSLVVGADLPLSIAKVFRQLFRAVVPVDPSVAQQLAKLLLTHSGQLAGLSERKHVLPVQKDGQLALELFFFPAFGQGQRVGDRAWNRELNVLRASHCVGGVLGGNFALLNGSSRNWFFSGCVKEFIRLNACAPEPSPQRRVRSVGYKEDVVDPYGATVSGYYVFGRVADQLPKEYRP